MIYTLDQLNGLVDVVECKGCGGKAAIVHLNDKPDLVDEKTGKVQLAKPPEDIFYHVTCENGKPGTHKVEYRPAPNIHHND